LVKPPNNLQVIREKGFGRVREIEDRTASERRREGIDIGNEGAIEEGMLLNCCCMVLGATIDLSCKHCVLLVVIVLVDPLTLTFLLFLPVLSVLSLSSFLCIFAVRLIIGSLFLCISAHPTVLLLSNPV